MLSTDRTPVIATRCIAMRAPVWQTITLYLLLDRVRAPHWVWIAVAVILGAAWILWADGFRSSYEVDILERRRLRPESDVEHGDARG